MIEDRLPFGVVEAKGAWVADAAARRGELVGALGRIATFSMDLLDVQFMLATAGSHVLDTWRTTGGVVADHIAPVPYPDDRYETRLMWWDRSRRQGPRRIHAAGPTVTHDVPTDAVGRHRDGDGRKRRPADAERLVTETHGEYTALLLDEGHSGDAAVLDRLRRDPAVVFVDRLDQQIESLRSLVPTPGPGALDEAPVWAYYSWRRTVVRLLGPASFRLLRLDRNRNKITAQEQERLRNVTVGIVGLSVGHAVALALTLEGACGGLRLADFDTLELSNLNRVPGTVLDLGVNKAVVAARRIAEIDPYVTVTLWEDGLDVESVAEFLDGTDVVIDECDSLDVKVSLRREAKRRGLPVLMATSDRGLLDVERFDLEPDRPVFHGVIGDVDVESLTGLGSRDKIPLVLRILDAGELSATMAASLVEVDETISTWPQLGGEVLLGGAQVAAAVRRIGLGQPLAPGRCRMDLDQHLDALTDPPRPHDLPEEPADRAVPAPVSHDAVDAVVHAAARAPSGGNVQPWTIAADDAGLTISVAPEHTTAMDVGYRGSCVAVGAALHNARIAASAAGLLGAVTVHDGDEGLPVATMTFGSGNAPRTHRPLRAHARPDHRSQAGRARPLDDTQAGLLAEAASREGARLCLVTDRDDIATIGAILGGVGPHPIPHTDPAPRNDRRVAVAAAGFGRDRHRRSRTGT